MVYSGVLEDEKPKRIPWYLREDSRGDYGGRRRLYDGWQTSGEGCRKQREGKKTAHPYLGFVRSTVEILAALHDRTRAEGGVEPCPCPRSRDPAQGSSTLFPFAMVSFVFGHLKFADAAH